MLHSSMIGKRNKGRTSPFDNKDNDALFNCQDKNIKFESDLNFNECSNKLHERDRSIGIRNQVPRWKHGLAFSKLEKLCTL